jgi:diguanylate cyclase (GGDEF)-like protein
VVLFLYDFISESLLYIAVAALLILFYYRHFVYNYYQHLFELEEAFDSDLEFVHLSKNILVKVMRETRSTAGLLYWMDEAQQELKLKTLNGIPNERVSQFTRILRKNRGILDQIVNNNQILKISLRRDRNFADLEGVYCSLLAVPLTIQKKTVGVLVLLRSRHGFNGEILRLLSRFAPRAAIHLDNSRLYHLAKETALENARLYINISKLYQQATADELTGLYNRAYLMQRTKEELKKAWRFKHPVSMLYIDLDNFNRVNEEQSHAVGDQLLTEFSDLLKGSIREYDVACRYGGEEFVVLLPHTKPDNAYDLAERLRKKIIKQSFVSQAKPVKMTASFGLSALEDFALLPDQPDEESLSRCAENLLAAADEAVNQAKHAGRNQVKLATATAAEIAGAAK